MSDLRQQIPDEVVKASGVAALTTDPSLVVSLSPNSPVPLPLLTKGTQGSAGVTTQDLKDSGRSIRTMVLDTFSITATTETLLTMSYSSDNAASTTGSSYTVTTGKRLRIQQMLLGLDTTTGNTAAANVVIRVRAAAGAAATLTSPLQLILAVAGVGAANSASVETASFPDGWEFASGTGVGFTATCAGFVATTAAPKVLITVIGYEY